MRYLLAPVALASYSSALSIRADQQCYQLTASGGASGLLGQLSDGQNRVGGGYPAACYCLSNGGFTDTSGRGCILTPPTTQFQCDVGASPTTGFAVSGGSVTYNGNSKFYACPVNDNGEYNVYTQPAPGQAKCVEITLGAGQSCGSSPPPQNSQPAGGAPPPQNSQPAGGAPPPQNSQPAGGAPPPPQNSQPAGGAPPPPQNGPPAGGAPPPQNGPPVGGAPPPQNSAPAGGAPPPPQNSQPAGGAPPLQNGPPAGGSPAPPQNSQPAGESPPSSGGSGNSCPADLNGNYQYPHLIVPVSSSSPSSAPGTSYNAKADSNTCTLFNFDIPASYAGHTCTLVFLFPSQSSLQTSSYTTSGSGGLSFSRCDTTASSSSSYRTVGNCSPVGSVGSAMPGNSYTVTSRACAAGTTVTYEMCATGGLSLEYFQDYNPSPIGAYIREC